jgi:AcrR family transcriptional regulator
MKAQGKSTKTRSEGARGDAAPRRLPILGQPDAAPERADAARNRARILAAARKLIGRRPISEICMDEVARAAKVGKGTLYRRFVDRSSLCRALLDDGERDLQERVIAGFGLPAGAPAAARLAAFLEALVEFHIANLSLIAEADASLRGRVDHYDAGHHTWRRRELLRLAAAAAREGSIPPLDGALAADLLLAALRPDLLLWHLAHGETDASLAAKCLASWRRSLGMGDAPVARSR